MNSLLLQSLSIISSQLLSCVELFSPLPGTITAQTLTNCCWIYNKLLIVCRCAVCVLGDARGQHRPEVKCERAPKGPASCHNHLWYYIILYFPHRVNINFILYSWVILEPVLRAFIYIKARAQTHTHTLLQKVRNILMRKLKADVYPPEARVCSVSSGFHLNTHTHTQMSLPSVRLPHNTGSAPWGQR